MREIVFFLVFGAGFASAQHNSLTCKTRSDLVGSCRTVHGRLMYYNGTPTFRIWVIGTKRLLGVKEVEVSEEDFEHPLMPEKLWGSVGTMEYEVYGDFEVCPLSEQEPHAMQMVCIESAKHVVAVPYGGARIKHSKPAQTK